MTIDEAIKSLEAYLAWATIYQTLMVEPVAMAISALRTQQEAEKNDPLTPEELQSMYEQPIYVVPIEVDADWKPHWCIYKGESNGFKAHATAKSLSKRGVMYFIYESDYEKTWLAYRRPPNENHA